MLDEISLKILKILQEKARIPNIDVARQVEMAPSAVLERIRKMERQGIIDGYEVRLNPEQFDRRQIAFIWSAPVQWATSPTPASSWRPSRRCRKSIMWMERTVTWSSCGWRIPPNWPLSSGRKLLLLKRL
jgi:DNA-binding Lrp family transcriptional regulator